VLGFAFHLAALGWTDTVVLAATASPPAPPGTPRADDPHAPDHVQDRSASYSRDFYKGLRGVPGSTVGTTRAGSLSLAQTPERMVELDYVHSMARHHDLPWGAMDRMRLAHACRLLERSTWWAA